MKYLIFFSLSLFLLSCNSNAQKTTYWEISDVYRKSGKEMRGVHSAWKDWMLNSNFMFVRKNDSLFFKMPNEFALKESKFKGLEQMTLDKEEKWYIMYDIEVSRNSYKILYDDMATADKNSREFVIEFKRTSKKEFDRKLNIFHNQINEIKSKINEYKEELSNKLPFELELLNIENKIDTIANSKNKNISISIPTDSKLKPHSDGTQYFNNIKVGGDDETSTIFKISPKDKKYEKALFYIGTNIYTKTNNSNNFNLNEYLAEDDSNFIVEKDKNFAFYLPIAYEEENQNVIIESFNFIKYFRQKNTDIFIYFKLDNAPIYNGIYAENGTNKEFYINYLYNLIKNIEVK